MAYTKIHAIKATVNKAIDYICNPDKTDEKIFVSSFACSPETAAIDFKYTLDYCRENSINKAYHLMQAFQPDEVSFEEAHQIGQELADKLLEGKYSYVVTTHIDKGHVHNHIIFCASDNIEHNKYHDCKSSYYRIRKISDELCKEHHLSIITPSQKSGSKYNEWSADQNGISWKTRIRKDINQCIKSSSSFDEFMILMKTKGYEIKEAQYIAFRPLGKERFVRGSEKSLGTEYTKERIVARIENKKARKTSILTSDKDLRSLIQTTSDEKLHDNIGLQKWVSKENLKIAAKTYSIMAEKNIQSIADLFKKIETLTSQVQTTTKSIISIEHQLKNLAEVIKYTEQYFENLPYHHKYNNSKNKDSAFQKFESQIILFGGAERMLKQLNINPKSASIEALKNKYQMLMLERDSLKTFLKAGHKELKTLNLIQTNMEQYINIIDEKNGKITKTNSMSKE